MGLKVLFKLRIWQQTLHFSKEQTERGCGGAGGILIFTFLPKYASAVSFILVSTIAEISSAAKDLAP